jgi:hypothetical protein
MFSLISERRSVGPKEMHEEKKELLQHIDNRRESTPPNSNKHDFKVQHPNSKSVDEKVVKKINCVLL